MLVRIWRLLTIMLAALTMGVALCHALCLAAAHAAFWIWIAPVNAMLVPLTPETLPGNWTALRDRWEYTHTAREILQIAALGFLVFSILAETPPLGTSMKGYRRG
jgi:hypothetical protein